MHRLTALCVRRPWHTVALVLAISAAAALLAPRADVAVGLEITFGAKHPMVRDFEAFTQRFGGGYPILIVFECGSAPGCDGALSPASLAMAYEVSRHLEEADSVSRVSSPATSRLLVATADRSLEARRFASSGDAALEELALRDPLWRRTLVSDDGRAGAIVVELASSGSSAQLAVMREIRETIEPWEAQGFRFHLAGQAALMVALHEAALTSALRVGAVTGAVLFIGLLFLLRSLPASLATLTTIGVASLWSGAAVPLLGWEQSSLLAASATLILVMGCADCIHLVASYLELRSEHPGAASALVQASRAVSAPCLMSTATTGLAFLSFGTGGIPMMTRFGALSALGITLALLLCFSLLPALIMLLPERAIRRRSISTAWQEVLSRLAAFSTTRSLRILVVSALLGVAGWLGVPKLRVDMDPYRLWSADAPESRSRDFVARTFQGSSRLEIELTLPPELRIEDPRTLAALARIEDFASRRDQLGEARSLLTLVSHGHHLLSGANGATERFPSTAGATGELIALLSFGDASALDPWVTLDQRRLRVSVEARSVPADERERVLADLDAFLERELAPSWGTFVTGPFLMWHRYCIEAMRSQATIVSASSVVVFLLLVVYLRSLRLGLLALVPNLAALLVLFGAMGHRGIPLDSGGMVVAPLAIGIATDDSVHFLTAYARARRAGTAPVRAIRLAITQVGEAVIATSLVLGLGFLAMLTSPLSSVGSIGLLSALAIGAGLVADLVVLPAAIAVNARA